MVQVHQFKVWDGVHDKWKSPPSKRTAESIAELQGEIIPDTWEEVDPKELDDYGRYFAKKPKVYVGYSIQAEAGHYEIKGPTSSVAANNAISILETLPKTKEVDETIVAQKFIAKASIEVLERLDAIFADPESPMPTEVPVKISSKTLARMVSNRIDELRRNAQAKLDGRRHWGGILLAVIIGGFVTLVLAKIFGVG